MTMPPECMQRPNGGLEEPQVRIGSVAQKKQLVR